MARFNIESIEFQGEGFGSQCVITFGNGQSFRFGGGRVLCATVLLQEESGQDWIELRGEYGASMGVHPKHKARIEEWSQSTGTCVGY